MWICSPRNSFFPSRFLIEEGDIVMGWDGMELNVVWWTDGPLLYFFPFIFNNTFPVADKKKMDLNEAWHACINMRIYIPNFGCNTRKQYLDRHLKVWDIEA